MPVISISLPTLLLNKIQSHIESHGYTGRSELIRDAVRDLLTEFELATSDQTSVVATITVIYDHVQPSIDEKLTRLRHEYNDLITTNIHLHIQQKFCLEIFIAEGTQPRIVALIGRIRATRGVLSVKHVTVPTD